MPAGHDPHSFSLSCIASSIYREAECYGCPYLSFLHKTDIETAVPLLTDVALLAAKDAEVLIAVVSSGAQPRGIKGYQSRPAA
jgi:hypothetical protein